MYKLFAIVVGIGLAVLFVLSCGKEDGQRGPLAGEVNSNSGKSQSADSGQKSKDDEKCKKKHK